MPPWCQRSLNAGASCVHVCHHLALTESSGILGRWRSCFVIEELSNSLLPLRHVRRSACCILMRSGLHAVRYLDLYISPVCCFYMTVGSKRPRIVDASQCLNRWREARPKCHIRYDLSCGCAVTVLPPVVLQVYAIHDSSLCFHGLSLERISCPSSKWKDSSLPCANGCTACRKTLGKNLSWLTKETRTLRGKVFG